MKKLHVKDEDRRPLRVRYFTESEIKLAIEEARANTMKALGAVEVLMADKENGKKFLKSSSNTIKLYTTALTTVLKIEKTKKGF